MEENSLKIVVDGLFYKTRKNGKKPNRTFPDLNNWMDAACSSGNKAARAKRAKGMKMEKNPGTFAKGKMKRDYERISEQFISTQAKGVHITGDVYISYYFFEPDKRRDPSNISAFFIKVFEDALQNCGVLDNDGWNIRGFTSYFAVDRYRPRVEVVIEELAPKKKKAEEKETESE